MRRYIRQSEFYSWPNTTGPVVVFTGNKNILNKSTKTAAGYSPAHCRDGPLIFHMRDGPPNVTGPPGGTGPPKYITGSSPPKTTGPPLDRRVQKSEECFRKNQGKLKHKNLTEIY
jgi:hypothetical protein